MHLLSPARATRLLAILLVIAAFTTFEATPSAHAIAGAELGFPEVTCGGSSASAVFNWQPMAGAKEQWIDLSLADNGFRAGTFLGIKLGVRDAEYEWRNLKPTLPHFWRIHTLTNDGWIASETGAFTPCAGPLLLQGPISCSADFRAHVGFRWAPLAGAEVAAQYLDLGYDAGFAPGTFNAAGPMTAGQTAYTWPNVPSDIHYYFRVNTRTTDGKWHTSATGSFTAQCVPKVSTELYGSADRLVVRRVGIDAPVNVRDVGFDGVLGDPSGALDVVRYNFALFPRFQGYPGEGGTTMVAGHLDYYSYGYAVFEPLRRMQEGDLIEYYRGDGVKVIYRVDWLSDLPPDSDWNSLAQRTDQDSIILITCNGTFNQATRNYDHRRVVHGVLVSTEGGL